MAMSGGLFPRLHLFCQKCVEITYHTLIITLPFRLENMMLVEEEASVLVQEGISTPGDPVGIASAPGTTVGGNTLGGSPDASKGSINSLDHSGPSLLQQTLPPSSGLPQHQPTHHASAANVGLLTELSPAGMMRRPRVLIIDLGSAFYLEGDKHFADEEMTRLDRLLRAAV